ncbi:MAG TPA: extracellular solute-binding protein [Candidatus Limnocylindrales bacterium]|nr:extracellular solute-binding protein [Candidatus Limnocylindrales bacterium]
MKNTIRAAGILGALTIAIAACGGGATPSPSASSPAASQPAGSQPVASGSAGAAAPLSGEITLWHSYGSGGGETGALNTVLGRVHDANPDLTIEVVEQPFDQIFTKWRTEVAAGGGADMFIAPNDSLGQDAREESIANLDEYLVDNPALEGYLPVAIEGSKVDGSFYMVPESLKAVALWYDKSKIATAPTTSDELLAAVKDGSIKLGVNQGVYHQFGWTGAFGGELMDDTGACTADDGGFAEAFAYLKELKDAGAVFNTDGNALKTQFQTGEIDAMIDGPWQTADFRTALGENLAVAPIPDGPVAAANPFTGTDGWYINPNLDPEQAQLAVNVALAMTSPEAMQTFVDDAGHVPANPSVQITDPITQGFADAAAAGLPRPQNEQFGNWWEPFGNALNQVVDTGADPATAVAEACTLMDEASGL